MPGARVDTGSGVTSVTTGPAAVKQGARAERLLLAYVLLWVLEGALRKWVAGGLQEVLFFIRVPVVVLMVLNVAVGGSQRRPPRVLAAICLISGGALLLAGASVLGGQPALGALPGARLILELALVPLCTAGFVSREGCFAVARSLSLMALPMTILVLVQVNSPRSAFVNRIFAADGADNFRNTADVVRATGTFTSALGLSLFASLGFALALAMAVDRLGRDRVLGVTAAIASSVTVAASGSRTAVIACVPPLAVLILVQAYRRPQKLLRTTAITGVVLITGIVVVPRLAPGAADGLEQRFAVNSTGELLTRVIADAFSWFGLVLSGPLVGQGPGSLAQGTQTVTGANFFVERELERWVFELGSPLFCLALALRWGLLVATLVLAAKSSRSSGEMLPLLAAAVAANALLSGQITGQGSVNGFAAISVAVVYGYVKRVDGSARD